MTVRNAGRATRRQALGLGLGSVAAALGLPAPSPDPVWARSASASTGTPAARAAHAARLRQEAARALAARTFPAPAANGDEQRYPSRIASFTKCLPHDALGRVRPEAYEALLRACASGAAEDFRAIPMGGDIKLANPQAAFSFGLDGPDPWQFAAPPFPRLDSERLAAEACELYWQALTRDVALDRYDTDPLIAAACEELSTLAALDTPRIERRVTPRTIFRLGTRGDLAGPYLSQFLLKEVPFGAIRLVPHVRTATAGFDYLVTVDDWLRVQNGGATVARHANAYRYVRTARDLAAYLNLDFSYQPFLTAALVLVGMEGTTDVRRPYKGAPYDRANPYLGSPTQSGFATFGVAHVLDLVARVANQALRASWFHKWAVHRSLRPEEYGGLVHVVRTGQADEPVHASILESQALARSRERWKTHLLPQAYPEGSPMHPSYPSGHAAIAGACATVLKALFDESFPVEEPVVVRADGLGLVPWQGETLTVGGEIDKLASNVAFGRNAAGIHWRFDAVEGLRLGEAVALHTLRETRGCFAEGDPAWTFTDLGGREVTV